MHDNKWSNNDKIRQVVTMDGLVKMIVFGLVNLFLITLTWWDFETLYNKPQTHFSLLFQGFYMGQFPNLGVA